MSIFVLYSGKRHSIKIGQSTSVQLILKDSCDYFGIDESKACLKYKKNNLDRSSPFVFTGVPMNATLDLILNDESKKTDSLVRVAITIEGGATNTASFKDSTTLFEILDYLVKNDAIPSNCVSLESSPELIYLRQGFTMEHFQTTTLAQLGLSG